MMYGVDVGWIAAALLALVLAAIEGGFRVGLRRRAVANDAYRAQASATLSSTLGILALLLAFTFSLSVQRFDNRSDAVVEEANAIGTTYLRAELLPAVLRSDVQRQLRDYVDLRVSGSALSTVGAKGRDLLLDDALRAQSALWQSARRAAEIDANPVTSGLFIQALNDMIDSYGRNNAAVNRRVPDVVVYLLCGTFLISGAILGFTCGVAGERPSVANLAMALVIVALIAVVLDLDRPRRGVIEVSQQSLRELQASIRANGRADPAVMPPGRAKEPR